MLHVVDDKKNLFQQRVVEQQSFQSFLELSLDMRDAVNDFYNNRFEQRGRREYCPLVLMQFFTGLTDA